MKLKEIKLVELENQLLTQQKELELKSKEIQEKDRQLKIKEQELEDLKKQLNEKKSSELNLNKSETPLISNKTNEVSKKSSTKTSEHTPIPAYKRSYSFKNDDNSKTDHTSVYNSLKQEIKTLSNQISAGNSNSLLKKQFSDNSDNQKLDNGFCKKYSIIEKRYQRDRDWPVRNSSLAEKPHCGYKSVDRQSRKYQESFIDKSFDHYKYWATADKSEENKENIAPNIVNTSSSYSKLKDHYTTPQIKSYKDKAPESKKACKISTTTYRSRSNAYSDSTKVFEGDTSSYLKAKNKRLDQFILRREASEN